MAQSARDQTPSPLRPANPLLLTPGPTTQQPQRQQQLPFTPLQPIPLILPQPNTSNIDRILNGVQPHGNGRELATLAKLYNSDEYKYKGDLLDSFDYKFTIFADNCQKASLPPEALPQAFSTMLAGAALEYYYTSCRNQNLDITALYERLRSRFEGEEYRRNMLREWNSTTLRQMIQEQPDKSKEVVFRTIVQRLQNLQRGLDIEL